MREICAQVAPTSCIFRGNQIIRRPEATTGCEVGRHLVSLGETKVDLVLVKTGSSRALLESATTCRFVEEVLSFNAFYKI